MITVKEYFMGRDATYPLAMTPEIEANAHRLVGLINQLLGRATLAGVKLPLHPNRTHISSGWRPPTVNAATPNAAMNSKHMTGHAGDVFDPDGDLDEWLMTPAGQAALVEIGLWMEHPSATKGWCHLQDLPPRSGNRVFFP